MLSITIPDLIQYVSCPRLVFFTYVQPIEKKTNCTTNRPRPLTTESELWNKLSSQRKIKNYSLGQGEREFQPNLSSATLGLKGRIDLVIKNKEGIFPVEFLSSKTKANQDRLYTLTAAALLLEDRYGLAVNKGLLYCLPLPDVQIVPLTPDVKNKVRKAISSIHNMILREKIPDQPKNREQCSVCHLQNFCGDVW